MTRSDKKATVSPWPWAAGAGFVMIAGILVLERASWQSVRLLECLLIFGFLAVSAWATRGALRNAIVFCCSLLFGLILLEGFALATSTNEEIPIANDSGLSQSRPLFGWGPTRAGVFHSTKIGRDGHVIFDTKVTIDSSLNRKTEPSDGSRPIAFFGDSWIYGDGVNDDATLPQAFADLTDRKIPVLNLSFAGWSPAQNLIGLREGLYKSLLDLPRHFILFTSTFHLERTACKGDYAIIRAPRLVADGSTVKFAGTCSGSINILVPLSRIARRFELYRRIKPLLAQPSRRDVELYMKIIEAFVADAKRMYGAKTTVLFAPFSDPYVRSAGYTESQIVDALRKDGVDVLVDKLPPIADRSLYEIAGDGHPTALANKARAVEVRDHLQKVDPEALLVTVQ